MRPAPGTVRAATTGIDLLDRLHGQVKARGSFLHGLATCTCIFVSVMDVVDDAGGLVHGEFAPDFGCNLGQRPDRLRNDFGNPNQNRTEIPGYDIADTPFIKGEGGFGHIGIGDGIARKAAQTHIAQRSVL